MESGPNIYRTKVQIVTLTYNKRDLLAQLGESLFKHCIGTDWCWTIIDNGDDGSEKLIDKFIKHTMIEYKKSDNRGNFSAQNNNAVLSSKIQPDVLIFLNNDIIAESDFVTNFYHYLSFKGIGAVGAALYYEDKNLQHAGILFQEGMIPGNLGKRASEVLGLHPKATRPDLWDSPLYMSAVTGACLGITKKNFFAINGFHSEFDWCFDDVDLCQRLRAWTGLQCIIDPKSTLIHLESQTESGDRNVNKNMDLFRGRYWGRLKSDDHIFKTDEFLTYRKVDVKSLLPDPLFSVR